jgi:SecD-like export protein
MKTLTQVLRDADPAGYETRSTQARAVTRATVLSAARDAAPARGVSRRTAIAMSAAAAVAGIAVALFTWQHGSVDVAAMRFEARLAESNQTILTNADIQTAKMVALHDRSTRDGGQTKSTFGIELVFTPEGAAKMLRATREHVGEHLQLRIDDEVVMAPLIRTSISSSAMLTGNYTNAEAQRIIEGLLKGKLELRNEK